jgi:hypothetical protein
MFEGGGKIERADDLVIDLQHENTFGNDAREEVSFRWD